MTQDDTDLGRLGRVAPPAHDVLDAAREVLWAAVAQEMLSAGEAAGEAGQAGETGSRRAAQRQKDQHQTDRPGP